MKVLALAAVAVLGCSKSEDKTPGVAAGDPWASAPPPTTGDPWAAPTGAPVAAAETQPAAPASGGGTTLAGSYQCLQMRYGIAANGMSQSSYVGSALGVFEIDSDGAYRSASYPARGAGRARASGTAVTFDAGPYAGYVGVAGTNSSGDFYIQFSEGLTEPPASNLRFNDHMCYRK